MTNDKPDLETDDGSSSNSELPSLRAQRTSMKRNISNLKTKIEKDGKSVDTTILECRLQILESYFKQIMHIQTQIEKLNPSDTARGDLEELYIGGKSAIMKRLDKNRRPSEVDQSLLNTSSQVMSHHNRLPQLKLPKFDGKYAEYTRFITTFNTLVHEDVTIPVIDKFNYLINCLCGQALAVVEAFQVSESNYEKALNRLKERYDNKSLIFIETVNSLFALTPMTKPSAPALRTIVDTVAAIRGSLLSLGSASDVVNAMLIHIVLSKIDHDSNTVYNDKQDLTTLPSWDECYAILSRRCQFLETCNQGVAQFQDRESKTKSKGTRPGTSLVVSNSLCEYCQSKEHYIGSCTSYLSLPIPRRFDFAKSAPLCLNCLRKGHMVSKCPSKSRCRNCHFSHHTTLHNPYSQLSSETRTTHGSGTPSNLSSNASSFQPSTSNLQQTKFNHPLSSSKPTTSSSIHLTTNASLLTRTYRRNILPTAVVLVRDSFGLWQPVRALLDSCSEINLITEESVKRLRLPRTKSELEIAGVSDIRTHLKYMVSTTIKSRISQLEWAAEFFVTKSISAYQPAESINIADWNIPEGLSLADPQFYVPQRIDLLLSCEIFFDLLLDGKISLGAGLPSLTNTSLGWIVGGTANLQKPSGTISCNITTKYQNLDDMLKLFWEIEEFHQDVSRLTEEEQQCELHYTKNTTFDENGRVNVRLPFKQTVNQLGSSFDIAHRRFQYLEKRLLKDAHLRQMYNAFMDEYSNLGHMASVDSSALNGMHYVIPHHPVLRPHSSSTKLRVVFDASSRTSTNISLNETLMVGPTIQQDLIMTLLVFRLHKYALSADICKMYRQFLVDERDRNFQLILWRKDHHDPVDLYRLNTITYGTSAAPFLAIRSLYFIADKFTHEFPIGAYVIKNDVYVDDILTGADTIFDLSTKKVEIIQILEKAGLQLSKWSSNCPELAHDSEEMMLKVTNDHVTKALGMSWKPGSDVFCFKFDFPSIVIPTKRSILSVISKIFDVFGFLGPIIVSCKILIQELWKRQMDWDSPLEDTLQKRWFQIQSSLPHIYQIEVPRFVQSTISTEFDIHGFADASQLAYGCCLYIRVPDADQFKTTLLIANQR